MKRARTLRQELMWSSLLPTLLALLLIATLVLSYEFLRYREERARALATQADIVAQASAAALLFNDPRTAALQLAPLKELPGLQTAALYDAQGRLFAWFSADHDAAAASGLRQNPLQGQRLRYSGPQLEVAQPIDHDGERLGTVYLRSGHDVAARLATYAVLQVVGVLAALALALAVSRRLQRRISAPLRRMTRVAAAVVEHRDWSLRAADEPNPDIQLLVRAFNGMLEEVQLRTGELEREMAERQRVQGQLVAADRRKDEFLATLAHELRNPLAPMTNAVALLARASTPPASRQRAIGILERQLGHVVRLIDDLLDVSRITTGKLVLHRENVDLVAVARSALELIEPVARQAGVRLGASLLQAPCVVVGDSARLLQILSNLLTNACRYTPAGGAVDMVMAVHDTDAEGRVEVRVRDTGIGIEPAQQERIFELFEQVDKSLERGNTGLGLGLTLARQLAHLHGGEITVQSKGIGHGACFTLCLPRPEQALIVPAAAPRVVEAGQPALQVLIADDNADFAASLEALLQDLGHRVQVVHDGESAWQAAQQADFDALLLDIGMPRLNGYELAQRLGERRGDAARPRLIAISGWGQPMDRERAAAAGFDHHFVKPVALDQLLAAMRADPEADTDTNPDIDPAGERPPST